MGASCCVKGYALFAAFLIFIETAHSLRCYQCNSTSNSHPFQCNEFLTSDIDLEPQPCDTVFGAQYCVKHTGRFEGGIGTKRFCSSVDLGNYCDYVNHQGDKLTYRTCIFTCTGDACNPGTTVRPTASWMIPIGIVAYKFLLQR